MYTHIVNFLNKLFETHACPPGGCGGLGEEEADHPMPVQQREAEVEAERAADTREDAQPSEAQLAAHISSIYCKGITVSSRGLLIMT